MLHALPLRRLLPCLLCGCLLALAAPARAAPQPTSRLFLQLGVGPGYMTNFTRGSDGGYSANDHTAPGVGLQLDVGARLVRFLSLHVTQLLDVGMPERSGLTPLYRWGFGLGGTFHVQGAQLGVVAGAHLTQYMNYVDDPSNPMGADIGPFAGASVGYAFERQGGLTVGIHAVGRYFSATDEYMGARFDPYGYTLGALVSVGFLGRPFVGR